MSLAGVWIITLRRPVDDLNFKNRGSCLLLNIDTNLLHCNNRNSKTVSKATQTVTGYYNYLLHLTK
jgi:hypothetical protein